MNLGQKLPLQIGLFAVTALLLFPIIAFSFDESKPNNHNLCFLSMNNPKEFSQTKEFFSELKKAKSIETSSSTLEIIELQSVGEYPIVSLEKAIQNHECNGLVLSGHHRKQGFDGNLAPGFLSTIDLLTLACREESKDWFNDIDHLWLQGCATGISQKRNIPIFADNFKIMFPNATIYTWTGNAPSRVAPVTIPFHFENFRQLLQKESGTDNLPSWDHSINSFFTNTKKKSSALAWQKLRYSNRHKWKGIYNKGAKSFLPKRSPSERTKTQNAVCRIALSPTKEDLLQSIYAFLKSKREATTFLPLLLEFVRSIGPEKLQESRALLNSKNKKASSTMLQNIIKNDIENPLTRVRALNLFSLIIDDISIDKEILQTITYNSLLEISQLPKSWDAVERKHYRWETFRELFLSEKYSSNRLVLPSQVSLVKGSEALIALMEVLLEVNPRNMTSFVLRLSSHSDLTPSARNYLVPLLALVPPFERGIIEKKIKENRIVRLRISTEQ